MFPQQPVQPQFSSPVQPLPAASASQPSLDTVSVWTILGAIVLTLFVVFPAAAISFAATKSFVLAAGTLVAFAIYVFARLARGNIIFPSTVLLPLLWFPVGAYALSAFFSGISFQGALWGTALEPDTLGFMLIATTLGTLAALALRRPEHYRAFFHVSAYAFVALVAAHLFVVSFGQFYPETISPMFSIVGSFADLAAILGLGVTLILVTFRFTKLSRGASGVLLVSGAAALVLLALANSSLVWTLLALVSLGFFVETVMRRNGAKQTDTDLDGAVVFDETPLETVEEKHSMVPPLVVLVVALFFLLGNALGNAFASMMHINTLNVRPSWESTLSVAEKTYALSPTFGSGPGSFGAQWLKYRDASLNTTVFWNVDFSSGIGFLPTSFVTTGIVGVFAWGVFLALFVILGLRALLLRTPKDAFLRHIAVATFVGSLYLFSVALFELPNIIVLALAFVMAGVFISTMRFSSGGRQWGILFSRNPRIGFVIVFALTILLLVSVVVAYTLVGRVFAAQEYARAASALSAGDIETASEHVQKGISFAPMVSAYQIQAGIESARLDAVVASSTISKSAAQQAYQTALSSGINAALTATNIDSSEYTNWLMLGNFYARAVPLGVSSAYESAKIAYDKARELSPTDPRISLALAQLHIANKNTKAAEEELKTAITLKQDYTEAIFLLSQLQVTNGKVKEALESALAAAYFAPNNANILFQVGVLYAAQNELANAVAALSEAVSTNPQFANARYFLAAVLAKQGNFADALVQLKKIAAFSRENAKALSSHLAALEVGKNPFPQNLLTISSVPVQP